MKMTSLFRTLRNAPSVALLVALAFGLASCKGESDDPEGAITGKNSHYELDYDNTEGDAHYRAYKATALKHAGGLVKVTFDKSADGANLGAMGLIFDLKANADDDDARDFFIIGINTYANLTTSTKGPGYYVSKFTNVTDLQADNFGTKLTDNPAVEKELVTGESGAAFKALSGSLPKDDDGNPYAYIYAYGDDNGNFDWAILNNSATDKVKGLSDKAFAKLEFTDDMYLAHGTIEASDTGYTKQTQNDLAVYAVIYKGQALSGEWNFVGTYKEAEEEL